MHEANDRLFAMLQLNNKSKFKSFSSTQLIRRKVTISFTLRRKKQQMHNVISFFKDRNLYTHFASLLLMLIKGNVKIAAKIKTLQCVCLLQIREKNSHKMYVKKTLNQKVMKF